MRQYSFHFYKNGHTIAGEWADFATAKAKMESLIGKIKLPTIIVQQVKTRSEMMRAWWRAKEGLLSLEIRTV